MPGRFDIFAVTGDDLVRFTLDGDTGRDADTLLRGAGAKCAAVDARDPNRIYVGTFDDGLHVTGDGGRSWSRVEHGIEESRVLSVEVSGAHAESGISVVYAGTEPSNLYRSVDGGRRWGQLPALRRLPSEPHWSFPPRPWTHHVRTIALHPHDPDWIAVGIELGGVMRSADGGASWLDHNPQAHSDAHQLLTHPRAPERLYEAAGQGIARSEDLGETWTTFDGGVGRRYAWAQAVDPEDPELWYVSVSRSPLAAHGDGDGQARLLRSRGNGWTPVDTWGTEPGLRRMPYALCTLPEQPGRVLVGVRGGTLLVTGDTGETWSRLALGLPDVIALTAIPG